MNSVFWINFIKLLTLFIIGIHFIYKLTISMKKGVQMNSVFLDKLHKTVGFIYYWNTLHLRTNHQYEKRSPDERKRQTYSS